MSKVRIAIDPGASGSIVIEIAGSLVAYKMPGSLKELSEMLDYRGHEVSCLVENVGFHRIGNSASSSVKFSRHVGELHATMWCMNRIVPVTVVPQKWMKFFGVMPKDKKDRKNALKSIAAEHFGTRVPAITLWNADALLLLKYGIDNNLI